ncbi:uncharacterized protein LOC124133090 [Haliotis rufescens]|uniref:uncharacterized protein LOC124133090 n=1 Tax=Haliotis rufescens TaxID=6454 RepID=UPI00201FA889|nr:uncharacterized protein LOC124133090 [Haliotis rufescens]
MGGFIRRITKRFLLLNIVGLCVLGSLIIVQYQRISSKQIKHVGDVLHNMGAKWHQDYKHWKSFKNKSLITIQTLTQANGTAGMHAYANVNDKCVIKSNKQQEVHLLHTNLDKSDLRFMGMKRRLEVVAETPSSHRRLDVSDRHTRQSGAHLRAQWSHSTFVEGLPFKLPTTEQIPGLFNFSILKEEEERHPLINLHQYQFTLNSDLCLRGHVYLLTIVHSALGHYKFRRRIRETFGSIRKAGNKTVVLVFSVGVSDNAALQKNITREANEFKDIIQGNFIDVYRNLSIKHIMGYHWMLNHCPQAAFVLKMDDDMFMNPYVVVNYLTHLKETTDQLICTIFKGFVPNRKSSKKYYVPRTMYPFDMWPDFCQGFAYIVSVDVLSKLYNASSVARFVAMDDVYVTGILRSITDVKATDFRTLKHYCPGDGKISVSRLNSVGVVLSYTSHLKYVFKKWDLIGMYTNGFHHLSADVKSSLINFC